MAERAGICYVIFTVLPSTWHNGGKRLEDGGWHPLGSNHSELLRYVFEFTTKYLRGRSS